MARTHRLQVLHADGELPQRQQQVQLCAQEGDVAHLEERGRQVDREQPEVSRSAAGWAAGCYAHAERSGSATAPTFESGNL